MDVVTTSPPRAGLLSVRLRCISWEVDGILQFELCAEGRSTLPSFTVGAHIDVHLPNGMVRSYSLLGGPEDSEHYRIAVQLSPQSRGGSRFMHESLTAGQRLWISPPRNTFPLVDAPRCILIGGGIGITPLFGMAQCCEREGRDWTLHYATRTQPALFEAWCAARADRVRRYITESADGSGGLLDLAAVVMDEPAGTHFYCCGPQPMIDAFLAATRDRPADEVHIERFTVAPDTLAHPGFEVELARDGRVFEIPPGRSILEVLLEAGLDVSYACGQGICGLCQTVVLAGDPDHRDSCLTPEDHARERTMMICCSGARTDKLVLDL